MITIQITQLSKHASYLAQSDYLAADRQGQGDSRLTLTPSVIPNSNYVIIVSDLNCLKYFGVFLYCNRQVHRKFFISLYILYSYEYFEQYCTVLHAVCLALQQWRPRHNGTNNPTIAAAPKTASAVCNS
jgi:hypothetical protein